MNVCLPIFFCVSGLVLLIATSRLAFVKKAIYCGWIDRSKKITLSDYVGNFDSAWISISIDYNRLLSTHPNDSILKEYVKEVSALKTISIIAASIIGIIMILGVIIDLCI